MRDRILETAAQLFYQNGIRAVGVDRVIAEAKIAKATLFRHFPSKEHLVVAYLESRSKSSLTKMQQVIDEAGASTTERVAAIFKALQRTAEAQGFRGCAFVMAVAEHEESTAIRNVARAHKDGVRKLFLVALLEPDEQARHLADQLALLYDGAMASLLIYRNPLAAQSALAAAMALLPPATPSHPR